MPQIGWAWRDHRGSASNGTIYHVSVMNGAHGRPKSAKKQVSPFRLFKGGRGGKRRRQKFGETFAAASKPGKRPEGGVAAEKVISSESSGRVEELQVEIPEKEKKKKTWVPISKPQRRTAGLAGRMRQGGGEKGEEGDCSKQQKGRVGQQEKIKKRRNNEAI